MVNQQLQNVVWTASQYLCLQTEPKKALFGFFNYVKKFIPIEYIILGKTLSCKEPNETFFLVDENGIKEYNVKYSLCDDQKKIVETHPFFCEKSSQIAIVENENDVLVSLYKGRILNLPKYQHVPFIIYRFEENNIRYGGMKIGLKKDTVFTEDILSFFNLLKAHFILYYHAFNQQRELVEIKQNKLEQEKIENKFTSTVIGSTTGLKYVFNQVSRIAASDISVLLRGETGTGKEIIARTIHKQSLLADKPFVAVNCGAIAPDLIDSELFGHVKGAFTGAISDHKGFFEQANGGTLFLDEVAELPLNVQVRLLRVLQEKKICRVGSNEEILVDFRLITATHRPLEEMIKLGTFREDLFYRINVVPIFIPPLRERKEDIPLLLAYFLKNLTQKFNVSEPKISDGEMQKLLQYDWPGNIRQLKNCLATAIALYDGDTLRFNNIELAENMAEEKSAGNFLADIGKYKIPFYDEVVKDYLEKVLAYCNGKIYGAGGVAETTGLKYSTVKAKLDKYKIPYGKNRKK